MVWGFQNDFVVLLLILIVGDYKMLLELSIPVYLLYYKSPRFFLLQDFKNVVVTSSLLMSQSVSRILQQELERSFYC